MNGSLEGAHPLLVVRFHKETPSPAGHHKMLLSLATEVAQYQQKSAAGQQENK